MASPTLPADKFDANLTFIKPATAPARVALDKLAVLPGFNTRVKDADYAERVTALTDSIRNHGFYDHKPFAVTMLPDDETVYIFDGEHRFDAARAASLDGVEFPDGLPVAWANDGSTVKDLTVSLVHGNNGEKLNMVEMAAVVQRLKSYGLEKAEIAKEIGKTERHVDNLFVIAGAGAAVKKAVAAGQIAGAEAVKLVRKDPKTAATKIADAVKAAAEKGKAKATPKTMQQAVADRGPKMKTIPVRMNLPTGETMGAVLKAIASTVRETVKTDADDKLIEDGWVSVNITVIDHEAAAEAEAKAAEKAKRAEESAALKAANLAKREEAAKAKAAKKAADDKAKAAKAKKAEAAKKATATVMKEAVAAKAAPEVKTDKAPKKPVRAKKDAPAPEVAETPVSQPDGTLPAADDGNGGL